MLKDCKLCGKKWEPKDRYQQKRNHYCSKECRAKVNSIKRKGVSKTSEMQKCLKCKEIKPKKPFYTYLDGKIKYVDGNYKRWNGNTCRDCLLKKDRKGRLGNHPTHIKGFNNELIAKKYFENLGFNVYWPEKELWGSDLILDESILVEVKTVIVDKSKYFYTPPVYKDRKKDDLIAIVLPNKKVLIEDMESHLRHCNNSGYRYLTKIVREYV